MVGGKGLKKCITLFAVLICMGTVYAALFANASILGYANINPVANMEIVLVGVVDGRPGEVAIYTSQNTSDFHKEISYNVALAIPTDKRIIRFQLKNTGNCAVRVVSMITTPATAGNIPEGIDVKYPDFTGLVFPPSASPHPNFFDIEITWLPGYIWQESQQLLFTSVLNFSV